MMVLDNNSAATTNRPNGMRVRKAMRAIDARTHALERAPVDSVQAVLRPLDGDPSSISNDDSFGTFILSTPCSCPPFIRLDMQSHCGSTVQSGFFDR